MEKFLSTLFRLRKTRTTMLKLQCLSRWRLWYSGTEGILNWFRAKWNLCDRSWIVMQQRETL